MSHVCHAHACSVRVPPSLFMCRAHWFSLRKPLRDAIWREYRQGQEVDKLASLRYLAVQQRAIGEVAFRPNDEAAARASAPYLVQSEIYRAAAIKQGFGDPLDGAADPPGFTPEASGSP